MGRDEGSFSLERIRHLSSFHWRFFYESIIFFCIGFLLARGYSFYDSFIYETFLFLHWLLTCAGLFVL
ncbi:hypothetical protein BGX38DRAFT_1224183 [Terfezia claveryi]|nr:hypothetical protein BGX38DRAFT_1224183 [Terfezia claveryi]